MPRKTKDELAGSPHEADAVVDEARTDEEAVVEGVPETDPGTGSDLGTSYVEESPPEGYQAPPVAETPEEAS
jgi:hypothetical protein